jgi:hypothetical protein
MQSAAVAEAVAHAMSGSTAAGPMTDPQSPRSIRRASEPSTTTGMIAEVKKGTRGIWILLGIAAITAMVVAVVIVASQDKSSKGTVVAKTSESAPTDAATVIPQAPPIDAGPPADAAIDAANERPDAGVKHSRGPNPEVAKMLAEGESLRRSNPLKAMAIADAVLQIEPRNARAKLLIADVLIASGDRDNGCKHLRDLGKNPTARARATQAGCPTD